MRWRAAVVSALVVGSASAWLGCNLLFDIPPGEPIPDSGGADVASSETGDGSTVDAAVDAAKDSTTDAAPRDADAGDTTVGDGPADGNRMDSSVVDSTLDSRTGDAVVDSTVVDTALDTAPASSPITGLELHLFLPDNANGINAVPANFASLPPVAVVMLPDGGVQTYPGTFAGNGTFTILGVPDGVEYYVQGVPTPRAPTALYFFETARTLDMSHVLLGRSTVEYPDAATSVNLNVTGAFPTGRFDEFEFEALNADNVHFTVQKFGTFDAGVTSFTSGFTVFSNQGLVTTSDTAWVAQLYADPNDTVVQAKSLRSYFSTMSLSVANGGTATLDASMNQIAPTSGHTVSWDRPNFSGFINQILPNGATGLYLLAMDAIPSGGDAGIAADEVSVIDLWAIQRNTAALEPIEAGFGDPFPLSWARVATVQLNVTASFIMPTPDGGVSNPGKMTGALFCQYAFPGAEGLTLEPIVGPPTFAQVNNTSAMGNLTAIGTQPTVSWSPPTTGTPTAYYVDVRNVQLDATNTPTFVDVARLYTGATTVTFPPGILQSQQTYVFGIVAVASAGDDATRPMYLHLPYCTAEAVTGLMVP